jgi:hypothetical protein
MGHNTKNFEKPNGLSSGLLPKFAFISGFYKSKGNATVVKACPAQGVVKNRRFIFPFVGTLRFLGRIAAHHIKVWLPAYDAGFVSEIVKKLFFRFNPHFICHNDPLSFLRAIPVAGNSGMTDRIYDACIACR